MSTHTLIENTPVQQKMARNSLVTLCCQNLSIYRCAGPVYGLHIRANGFAYSAFIKAPGYVKKGNEEGEE